MIPIGPNVGRVAGIPQKAIETYKRCICGFTLMRNQLITTKSRIYAESTVDPTVRWEVAEIQPIGQRGA